VGSNLTGWLHGPVVQSGNPGIRFSITVRIRLKRNCNQLHFFIPIPLTLPFRNAKFMSPTPQNSGVFTCRFSSRTCVEQKSHEGSPQQRDRTAEIRSLCILVRNSGAYEQTYSQSAHGRGSLSGPGSVLSQHARRRPDSTRLHHLYTGPACWGLVLQAAPIELPVPVPWPIRAWSAPKSDLARSPRTIRRA